MAREQLRGGVEEGRKVSTRKGVGADEHVCLVFAKQFTFIYSQSTQQPKFIANGTGF